MNFSQAIQIRWGFFIVCGITTQGNGYVSIDSVNYRSYPDYT